MARQKSRKPFPANTKREKIDKNAGYVSNERSGVVGFLSDRGVRETIESVLVAVILALLFRTFEAEAFVIPTGSMAPALQGQHRDINCEQCGYLYQTGASEESSTYTSSDRKEVTRTFCPICRAKTTMSEKNWDHTSNNGDRILVNKFVYDFSDPKRFDVIVFKNPNNGKQNYIKRLIGLPGEKLIIENGDIFRLVSSDDGVQTREIVRKPSSKLSAMLQVVDDTDFIPQLMHDAGWPLRWQQWHSNGSEGGWESTIDSGKPNYYVDAGDQVEWLNYRNLVPRNRPQFDIDDRRNVPEIDEWEIIKLKELPDRINKESPVGSLITDYYCYNDRQLELYQLDRAGRKTVLGEFYEPSFAMHWVGDLAMECWTEVKSDSGTLELQVVEGGAKFTCSIDVASGDATLSCGESTVQFVDDEGNDVATPKAKTNLNGSGTYRILFANVDDQLRLSINNRFVEFDAAKFERSDDPMPRFDPDDQDDLGDAEPIGIGAKNLQMEVTRLKVLRDVYYTSPTNMEQRLIANETRFGQIGLAWSWIASPEFWESKRAQKYFKDRFREKPYVFDLGPDEFLPMGDNSPSSLDGRVWDGPKNVNRDMMIGRALFIYWPHALNSPVPYFPNFQKMKFIR